MDRHAEPTPNVRHLRQAGADQGRRLVPKIPDTLDDRDVLLADVFESPLTFYLREIKLLMERAEDELEPRAFDVLRSILIIALTAKRKKGDA